nr:hypothetical protein [Tanacetum cinerariifolium]
PIAPTTAEQRLARKNELKAHGTLLMALPDKHQLKFNIHKDAKTLMEVIEKWFGGNKETKKRSKTDLEEQSLDDLFNSLKIYEAGVKSSSSASTFTQNISFVSSQNSDSTNKPVSVVASISAASVKIPIFALPNVDTLSNAAIYSFFASQSNSLQLDNDDLKKIDADDLEEIDLKWQMAMLTVRASVMVWAVITGAFRHKKNQPTMRSWHSPPQVLLVLTMRDNALVVLRQKFKKAEQERDELQLKLEKFQTYSKNLSQLLASQTNYKTRLGYTNQVFTSSMFDCDEMFSSATDESLPASPIYDRYPSGEGYHAVPPPYKGTFMPPKPDLVFHDAPNVNETVHTAFNVELSLTKPDKDLSHTHRPSAPIIEDLVSDIEDDSEAELPQNSPSFFQTTKQVKTLRPFVKPVENYIPAANHKTTILKPKTHKNSRNRHACFVLLTRSKLVPLTAARPVTTTDPQPYVTRPRPAKTVVTKPHSPPRRNINRRPSPKPSNFPPTVTTVKAPMINAVKGVQGNWENPQHALKDKGVIYSGCPRHMIGNMSYLSDFEAINGGYVVFGGNLNGGKITRKDTECILLSPEFKLPDKNQLLLRVPRENNMYNVDLKNIVPSGDLTCLFAKATLDESNHWHRRLGHINFKTMNKLVKGNQSNPSAGVQEQFDVEKAGEENVQQYVLFPLWSSGFKNPQNTDDATFEGKKPEFEGEKPASEVYVSLSSSAQTKKHDDKTKREAKGKIPTVGQISTNSTNTFSAASPSNTVVSLTLEKSSYVDTSQYLDDPNMPALEDITYFDDEEDVGTEADFTNLETNLTVSPIPTNKVQKYHLVTHIIGDLSLATRTRSMTRVAKDQGRPTQINNKDFHTCMFVCFLSQEEPKMEEDNDYEEVFTPVVMIEAIRLFLAYASFMGFMVYQMDVKSVFLYETIKEEVYVCQPPRFEDLDYPKKVYNVVKALYGLDQAPRAWYETLANYLLENGFERGKIDQTLFIKKQKGDILLVQVYVDDNIFGSYNKDLCKAFEKLMKDKFQRSSMDGKSANTPINTEKPLLKDPNGEDVDVYTYRSMIGSLMYRTSSRPDIIFAVCGCARFQVTPIASHLHAVKRIFRYLKGYDNQVFTSSVFDCDEMFCFESDVIMPASPVYDRYKSGEWYHAVPPPYTGTFMPLKPDFVFHDAPTVNESVPTAFNVEPSPT